jgi:predicted lipoprotein with Yx(FWY)xxD motif
MKHLMMSAAALMLVAGAAFADPAMVADGMLTNEAGMTLYTFDKDAAGVSNCIDDCVANWPILDASAGGEADDDWAIVERSDGAKQWAYYGKPLYTFVGDAAPGDITGDGKGGVWHIARPE